MPYNNTNTVFRETPVFTRHTANYLALLSKSERDTIPAHILKQIIEEMKNV